MTAIQPGWYVPTRAILGLPPPRWALGQIGDYVRYNVGGRHRVCLARTFRRWASRFRAEQRSNW